MAGIETALTPSSIGMTPAAKAMALVVAWAGASWGSTSMSGLSDEAAPQGFFGVVVDPAGAPVGGAEVYLKQRLGTNLSQFLARKGVRLPLIANTRTDTRGMFTLGMEVADATRTLEIAIVSTRWQERNVPDLHVTASEWQDLGTIALEKGAHVHGHVTVAGSGGVPVPNARVTIKKLEGSADVGPIPGRENGIELTADANGVYGMVNAPVGSVSVAAVAPGFAWHVEGLFESDSSHVNECNFELVAGHSLAGIVTDHSGVPLGDVLLTAVAVGRSSQCTCATRSDSNGRFVIIGLLEGPCTLTANGIGFIEARLGPVQPGDSCVTVVLEKQGSARVMVRDKNGRLLPSYMLTLKTCFEGQSGNGFSEVPPMTPRLGRDGVATVLGMNPDQSYVFQVEAAGYAKTYSEPFLVALGAEPPLVVVPMNEGGVIEGTVFGPAGQPVSGASITTLPNGFEDSPFAAMFIDLMPIRITLTQVQTGPDGRFRVPLLTPGDYQLKVAHLDYFEVLLKNQKVETGVTTQVPPVTMQPGTVLTGQVFVDGKPGHDATARVVRVDEQNPRSDSPSPSITFLCETIADAEGRFRMPKRLAPGRYRVIGKRQNVALFSIHAPEMSIQEIEVPAAQKSCDVTLRLGDR